MQTNLNPSPTIWVLSYHRLEHFVGYLKEVATIELTSLELIHFQNPDKSRFSPPPPQKKRKKYTFIY